MKKIALVLTLLVMMVLSCNIAFAGAQDFDLVNRTGMTITQVYVSPSSSDDWKHDVLGDGVLLNGYKKHITFREGTRSTYWDLKVVTEDGSELEYDKFNLKEINTITIRGNGDADYE